MSSAPHDDQADTDTDTDDGKRQDSVTGSPRATDHPTGQQQAEENAENEPAG